MKNKQNIPSTDRNKSDTKKGITQKEEVAANPDQRIDQDFPGFPHAPSNEKTIKPETEEDKVNANLKKKNNKPADENLSVGSANAFEATENEEVLRGELENEDKGKDKKGNNY
jgi:hypothetical protein